mgnify:CR=1 FL=1
MTAQTVTITNSIPLPKAARWQWRNKQAFVEVFDDTIIVKRIALPAWDELLPKLRKAGKQISPRMIRDAVAWARKNP